MSAAGILHGLKRSGLNLPVLGIQVGANPRKRLEKFAPAGWEQTLEILDITYRWKYHKAIKSRLYGVALDPYYEAKCAEYIQAGDLFWIVGIRKR